MEDLVSLVSPGLCFLVGVFLPLRLGPPRAAPGSLLRLIWNPWHSLRRSNRSAGSTTEPWKAQEEVTNGYNRIT